MATLVNYTCNGFIELTPDQRNALNLNPAIAPCEGRYCLTFKTCKCGFKRQLRGRNENVIGEKFTNTSLMELHSP